MKRRKIDRVFVSYSHKDKQWRDELLKHLKPLDRNGSIDLWVDEDIEPGDKWNQFIKKGLATSQTAILLVSQNFQDSDFITKNELPNLILASEKEGIKLFWVPISDCILTDDLGDFQAASNPSNPLDGLSESERNSIFARLARELREYVAGAKEKEAALMNDPEYVKARRREEKAAARKVKKEKGGGVSLNPKLILMAAVFVALLIGGFLVANKVPRPSGTGTSKVRADKPYINTLGMEMRQVAELDGVLFSKWETRVQDFAAFVEPGSEMPGPKDHPMTNVTWQDAVNFCKALSQKEGLTYRLPTDHEWSVAIGLNEDPSLTPAEKKGKISIYPWGTRWPPPSGFGNYEESIRSYSDGFDGTSPCGSFSPDKNGLMDLSGNVWEWCSSSFSGNDSDPYSEKVLRGGSWSDYQQLALQSSSRNNQHPGISHSNIGFRCVLEIP